MGINLVSQVPTSSGAVDLLFQVSTKSGRFSIPVTYIGKGDMAACEAAGLSLVQRVLVEACAEMGWIGSSTGRSATRSRAPTRR